MKEKLLNLLSVARGITANSKEVEEGFIFFALRGTRFDGHNFVKEALKRGAVAVVVEREVDAPEDRVIKVDSTRRALGEIASLFFDEPSRKVKVIGVTGTNGKTTTTYILEKILSSQGFNTGVIGTVNYRMGSKILGEGRTTPDQITWHRTLSEMAKLGADYVVAEISSHALDQDRVWGTSFFGVAFTNLSRDHLDYHLTMENYFKAKSKLFELYSYQVAVVNVDDTYGRRLAERLDGKELITFGRRGELKIENFKTSFEGSRIRVSFRGESYTFRTNLIGDFQAYNLACALAFALHLEIPKSSIEDSLVDVKVPGRFEVIRSKRGVLGVVDYAHTPEAMENVLKTLNRLKRGRLIVVFGAGGNRDRGKRPLMGAVSEKYADAVILTSDNPRFEDPLSIIEDILKGMRNRGKIVVEPDRERAIRRAVSMAEEGDVVAILGKGHEEYQEIEGEFIPFSDKDLLRSLLT